MVKIEEGEDEGEGLNDCERDSVPAAAEADIEDGG